MIKNNNKDNRQRINYQFQVGERVLMIKKKGEITEKLAKPTEGPYDIVAAHENGNVTMIRDTHQ